MSKWTDTVSMVFKKNRATNPSYMFKDALKDAKEVYKSGETIMSDTVKDIRKKIGRKTQKKRRKLKTRRRQTATKSR
jgi:hypothetical protein